MFFKNNFVVFFLAIVLVHVTKWAIFIKQSTHTNIKLKPHNKGKLVILKPIEMEEHGSFEIGSGCRRPYN